ncbi:Urease accessory protein ureD [Syntrophobotulus glycolicus DSM 8271]|uniref:Urease accessory protein UreD n=1 Tax=Syntrophobotulus glycolicus (strain DSM 8271 / FlGlyR) TaxID=645991 RepID=F0T2K3_SYNGF|nr:urease accessory protein UreD [Syntrophobotulus glycolicus]ADY55321.1 Urease accessory protein ureD [Syntrophobotulus glycolicus DSM 8271]
MINRFGQESKLIIGTGCREGRTVLEEVSFTAPYKIAKPFYGADGTMRLTVMTASAGLMSGDRCHIQAEIGAGSKVEIGTQAFAKIHKMNDGFARQQTEIRVAAGASLRFLPLPVLPFAGSAMQNDTRITLEKGAALQYAEVLSCGRYTRGEKFQYAAYQALTELRYDGKLVFRDNTRLVPGEQDLSGIGFYEGFLHQATGILFNSGRLPEALRDRLAQDQEIEYGLTEIGGGGLVIRILGRSAQSLYDILNNPVG